jgi:hypothetical protein
MGTVQMTLPIPNIASVRLWKASSDGEELYRIVTITFEYWGAGYHPQPPGVDAVTQ